ncbi:MAG: hypothetical protein GY803_01480 [Chloroflexi bacterium]|nr:hypothetical protein [Chloroflexota bacterium]
MTHATEFQLNEYLDGELDEAEQQAVETHLAVCGDCWEALANLQAIFFALDKVAEVELTADLSARVAMVLQPKTSPISWLLPLIQAVAVVGMAVWLWPALRDWALTVVYAGSLVNWQSTTFEGRRMTHHVLWR